MLPVAFRLVAASSMLVIAIGGGCASRTATGGSATTAPATSSTNVSAQTADVRVTSLSGAATARVGQSIGVTAPNGQWQVDFDAESLQLLTPPDDLAAPGSRGWVWRALKPGRTDIVFTARARCDTPPCPPNVAQFTLTIDVTPASVLLSPGGSDAR